MLVHAYGAHAGDKALEPLQIVRRVPGAHDVQIEIAYCGICHSDLHQVRAEWAGTQFPCVTGHEIVGRVSAVGAHVSAFKAGDLVGIGCIVDSCRHCEECDDGLENYCDGMVGTYNGKLRMSPAGRLVAILSRSLCMNAMCCASVIPRRNWLRSRLCCARGLLPIRRCATGMPAG